MKDTNTSTTEQHTDCLLGQGTYEEYTPICQCPSCLVDPVDEPDEYEQHRSGQANAEPFEDDYSGFNDGPSDEEIKAIPTMTADEYWESFTSNDRPW
tara:strand:+ start:23076 stop:23366 length:291 start_codon:yes stop_codon:yes gene_type:complete